MLVFREVLLRSSVRVVVVAVLLKLQSIWKSRLWDDWRVAVGLVRADYLIGFEDQSGDIHVWIVFDRFDDFVGFILIEGI